MKNRTRFRSLTTSIHVNHHRNEELGNDYTYIDLQKNLFNLSRFASKKIKDCVIENDLDLTEKLGDKDINSGYDEMLKIFNKGDTKILTSQPDILVALSNMLKEMLNETRLSILLNTWPPKLSLKDKKLRHLILLLVKLIHESKNSGLIIQWCMKHIYHKNYISKENSSKVNSILNGICLCKKKKKISRKNSPKFWAILDKSNHFSYYKIDDDNMILKTEFDVGRITVPKAEHIIELHEKNSDKIFKIKPVDKSQCSNWSNLFTDTPTYFPIMLNSCLNPIPEKAITALYESIISDDLMVAKSIFHYDVSEIKEATNLASAMLDIFSYAGKVNNLFVMLIGSEFENTTHNTILRTNSHLTNMFKVIYKRYGQEYYQKCIKKILKEILQNDLSNVSVDELSTMLFSMIKEICASISEVPMEFKHISSILKTFSAVKFNSKRASYNSLSNFFFLRFITSIFTNPINFDPSFEITQEQHSFLVYFSQIMQKPFNLNIFTDQFEQYESKNSILIKHIFPKVVNFVFSLSEITETPKYEIPSPEKLHQSLEYIMAMISQSEEKFSNKYKHISTHKDQYPTISWNIGSYFLTFFKESINELRAINHKKK